MRQMSVKLFMRMLSVHLCVLSQVHWKKTEKS